MNKLYKCFDEINNSITNIKILNASQYQYFKIVTDNIASGIISFSEDGTIELYNKAVSQLLGIKLPKKIEELEKIDKKLPEIIRNLKSGERKVLKVFINYELTQLAMESTEVKMFDKKIKLVNFQNIKNELENNELDSWQKLIRVMNHEIINSTGPISSAASTLRDKFFDEKKKIHVSRKLINEEVIKDTVEGLNIIEERSDGLTEFVKKYRELTALSLPIITKIQVNNLFNSITTLLEDMFTRDKISVKLETEPDSFFIEGDKNMIEQILINLLNNSVYALRETKDKKIVMKAYINKFGNSLIEISDNGVGISKEKLDRIFVP
ncbi:PAS domain-containing sensor histidine kinase, partial [Bacteroidota bacterium]